METVRVYDFDTKKLVTIPATELAPGMIRAHVEGIEGEVFIDASKLQNSPVRHDPFDEGTRRVLQVLYNTIHEVYNVTPQKWEEGFLRDTDPASEIRLWFKIAACYRHFTNGRGLLPEQKMDIFKVIIAWINNGPEHVLQTANPPTLSRERVKEMVEQIVAGVATPDLEALLHEAEAGDGPEAGTR